jgi:protein SCO1/2
MLQTVFSRNSMLIGIVLLMGSCARQQPGKRLPYFNTPDFTPLFLDASLATKKVTHAIAPFSFTSQDGKVVTEKNIAGKIHVANFVFTSCGSICPLMTEQMKKVAEAYEQDTSVVILSYSVTPWIDTPEKLRKYRNDKEITKNNWYFLTGSRGAIYSLARTSYFAEEDLGFTKDSSAFLHTEHFILVDQHQKIRGIYNGTLALEAEQLIKDIAALKLEQE